MRNKSWRASTVLLAAYLASGCASVPKEVVELSYQMGGDLQAVHKGYRDLIHERFESFRARRLDYFEHEWKPLFISNWVKDGHLVEVASGQLVWSTKDKIFTQPPAGRDKEGMMLESVDAWSRTALKKLDEKRRSLTAPLDAQEKELTDSVDEAFDRLYRENAAITAELNSLRKVQEVQDEMLSDVHGTKLRDQINGLLTTASQKAEDGLEQIRKADSALDMVKAKARETVR